MEFAHPETLVDVAWLAAHRSDPGVRVVEVDVDVNAYDDGHVPGAIAWNWTTELSDRVRRDILSKEALEALLSRSGIDEQTTIVLYGDNNNWFAAWAFWQLKMCGHADVRMLDGGRRAWLEGDFAIEEEHVEVAPKRYVAKAPDASMRALLPEVMELSRARGAGLVDVRSRSEFTGELLAPPGLPETCQRGGHIPGAVSFPWSRACSESGHFLARDELERLVAGLELARDRPVITYCRIGERSSHTWFVLKYLLGFDDVKNYDGSWTEWGNLVGADIEKP